MNEELKQAAVSELIHTTYENMGIAVINVNPIGLGAYRLDIIDQDGPKEVLVNVLLHMSFVNQRPLNAN